MDTTTGHQRSKTARWLGVLPVLALVAGLAAWPSTSAQADEPAYLSVYAPGASAAAPVGVQAQSGRGWVRLAGWQGYLTGSTDVGTPFIRWAVDPGQLGQGPFRAVAYSLDQKRIVAASDPFYLPGMGGINLAVTIGPAAAAPGAPPGAGLLGKTLPAPPRQAPLLSASTSIQSSTCHTGGCANAHISAYVSGVPLNAWVAVEWQNANGDWLPVPNWESQGDSDPFNLAARLVKHWDVLPAIYGHGPFRWAVYAGASGGMIGVSPSFSLPAADQVDLVMQLSP